jgi:hypothetical protein
MKSNLETELLANPNINALLTDQERHARSLLMDKIIMHGSPVKPSEFQNNDLLQELGSKGVIVQDEDGPVNVVYPVSALPTPHKVKLNDGRTFFAICAVDSLGSAFTFAQDIEVTSSCSYCQKPVSVAIKNGEISTFDPDTIFVTHTDLVDEVNWAGTC